MPHGLQEKPNVILITCHDLGRWLDCHGRRPMGTPNLDRLASAGARFDNFFCTSPSCSPSRGSLMTGRYPHSNGLMGLANLGWDLPETEPHLARLLSSAGYETILCGIQHEHHDHTRLGYDRTLPGRTASQTVDAAIAALDGVTDAPFFMAIGTSEAHRSFHSAQMTPEADVPMPAYLPDCDAVRREMVGFRRLVRDLDDAMGRLFDALDEAHLAEQTLVIFTTDHGIDMPRAKGTLYDPGIEASLIMRCPGMIQGGRVSDELVSGVDLAPTILELLDVPVPANVQGESFVPILHGENHQGRKVIFAEKMHHVQFDPMRCVRTRRFKYIDNITEHRSMEIPAGGEMDIAGDLPELYKVRRPRFELYDLEADPWETTNLAGQSEHAEVEHDLRDRLLVWQQETDDPLLRDVLPLPPGRYRQ